MQLVQCPHCSYQLQNDPSLAGQFVGCPQCGGHMQMPGAAPATTSSPSRYQPPRQPKRSNNAPLLIGGLAGILTMGLIGFAIWYTQYSNAIVIQLPEKQGGSSNRPARPLIVPEVVGIKIDYRGEQAGKLFISGGGDTSRGLPPFKPYAKVRLRNGTDTAISQVELKIEYCKPGRSVSEYSVTVWDNIPSGIEPGETIEHEFPLSDLTAKSFPVGNKYKAEVPDWRIPGGIVRVTAIDKIRVGPAVEFQQY